MDNKQGTLYNINEDAAQSNKKFEEGHMFYNFY